MTIDDLIKEYGHETEFVKQTGFTRDCWFKWQRAGYVPIKSQHRISELTGGRLKACWMDAVKGRG